MSDDWRNFLLRAIDAPESPTNLSALQAWASSEGMQPLCHNHLAATDRLPFDRPGPNAIVYCYPDEGAMIRLYAAKFRSDIYRPIYDAFRADGGYWAIWQAINKSPWAAGQQEGLYPVGVYDKATSHVAPPTSVPLDQDSEPPVLAREPSPAGLNVLPSMQPGPKEDHLFAAWDRLTHVYGTAWPRAYRRLRRSRRAIDKIGRPPPAVDESTLPEEWRAPH